MCGLYFDPKAMAFLKLHLAFSRQFRDDCLSIRLLVFILYYSGVFPLLQTEFLPKVYKMLSHQLLEFSFLAYYSIFCNKETGKPKNDTECSWVRSRCLLARVPSHIISDPCGAREKLRRTSRLRHPLDSSLRSECNFIIIGGELE